MRKTKAVSVGDKTYVVRELTPLEVDSLFDVSAQKERTTVDGILDVHLLDTVLLGAMLDVPPERCAEIIGQATTSEYMPIIEAAKELNPDFFAMARRRLEYVGQLGAINEMFANQMRESASASASDGSSSTATTKPGITA